jgi:6-phosphofructokinase
MRVGVLTGGGDCPGLNAAIRAVVRKAEVSHDDHIVGFRNGWRGVIADEFEPLDVHRCRGILPRGGTILGTSRTNPFKVDGGVDKAVATIERHGLGALIAIGGEGTLSAARRLADLGLPIVGIPKTIDNDVNGTDVTIGFNTAVEVAVEAIDRLHTTAESHDRVMVCEVMGRHVGWIALNAGLAAGAAAVLIPEDPFDVALVGRHLLHVLRGGTPCAFDRMLATRFGIAAVDAAHDGAFGMMVGLQGGTVERVGLGEATAELKRVPDSLFRDVAKLFLD